LLDVAAETALTPENQLLNIQKDHIASDLEITKKVVRKQLKN
jgi:hypothetical protein